MSVSELPELRSLNSLLDLSKSILVQFEAERSSLSWEHSVYAESTIPQTTGPFRCRTNTEMKELMLSRNTPLISRKTRHNNNTFTWSGPSGVFGCTGQRPIGPAVGGASQGDGCRAVPLNLLNLPVGRNLRGGKRSRSQVLEG
jgi:hypothetical protein